MEDAIIPPSDVLKQITQRQEAKKNGNYELADKLQKDILNQGWVLQEKQGVTHCRPKKRSNTRALDNHRRQTTRKKQQYVRKKKTRFPIFVDFVIDTFFNDTIGNNGIPSENQLEKVVTDRNINIIDVAGGKARLALEFTLDRNIPCTVVDPCTTRLSAFTTRRIVNLAIDEKETNNDPTLPNIPIEKHNQHDLELSSIFHKEEVERLESHKQVSLQQRTQTFLRRKGFIIHNCLFNEEYIKNNKATWNNASLVIGMHPDEATEDIVDFALKYNKSFAVVPCCVFPSMFPHRKLSCGRPVRSVDEFISYLLEKHPDVQSTELAGMAGNNVVVYKK